MRLQNISKDIQKKLCFDKYCENKLRLKFCQTQVQFSLGFVKFDLDQF